MENKRKFYWITVGLALCCVAVCLLLPKGTRIHSSETAAYHLALQGEKLGYRNALSELTEVYSEYIDGDGFYRLQQNYEGIPVYGRTVVYVADEKGRELAVTQNVRDIPEGLDLTPIVTAEMVQSSLRAYFDEEVPEMTLSDNQLCIWASDSSTNLAYRLNFGMTEILVDAHSGQVLYSQETVQTSTDWAILAGSSQTFQALTEDDGTYVMKDTEENIYVFDTEGKTFYSIGGYQLVSFLHLYQQLFHENLTLVKSPDRIFGNDDDNVSNSLVATEALGILRDIRSFWQNELNAPEYPYDMALVVNDSLGLNTTNAAGGLMVVPNWRAELLPESRTAKHNNLMALITLGKAHSDNLQNIIDIIGHEYGHVMSFTYVDWSGSGNYQNGALNEAFSDIFGELTEYYLAKDKSNLPDWQHGGNRNIEDPQSIGYPAHVTHANNSGEDASHGYSTIISHAAYLMWKGVPGDPDMKLSTAELAQLWYRAMMMMPSDADFSVCRNIVEKAGQNMGLTPKQLIRIQTAFSEVGIMNTAERSGADYLVDQIFTLNISNPDGNPTQNWSAVVRNCDPTSSGLIIDWSPVLFSTTDGEDMYLKLDPGYYQITVNTRDAYPGAANFTVYVTDQGNGAKQLKITVDSIAAPLPSVPDTPENTEAADHEQTGNGYRIVRWDRSGRTEDGKSGMDYYFDYVVVDGDSEAIRKVNDYLYADAEAFMTQYSAPSAPMHDLAGNLFVGYCKAESQVTFFENGLLGINVHTDEYMGGNTSHADSYGLFFNLNTGEPATLLDLTGMEEKELLPILQNVCWEYLQQDQVNLQYNAWDTLMGMKLADYSFYVWDGEIIIHFRKYLMTAGVAGAQNVPTGLYVGSNNRPASGTADITSAEKVTLGSEGPVTYENIFLDRWHKKLNKMGHENAMVDVHYLELSGNGAVGAINADLYQIAENFVNTYPRSEVETMHYAYGMAYAFSHQAYMNVMRNGGGIISVSMDYHGFWGEDNIYSGTHSGTLSCNYTYSLTTGERLTLSQLTGMTEEELLPLLKKGVEEFLTRDQTTRNGHSLTEETLAYLENVSVSDFGVWVSESGEIGASLNRIHMREADGNRGYWYTASFGLGLYVD